MVFDKIDDIKSGDILYINGAYTSLFKGKMILYEGKRGMKMKIGEYYFNFSESVNYSDQDWEEYLNPEKDSSMKE